MVSPTKVRERRLREPGGQRRTASGVGIEAVVQVCEQESQPALSRELLEEDREGQGVLAAREGHDHEIVASAGTVPIHEGRHSGQGGTRNGIYLRVDSNAYPIENLKREVVAVGGLEPPTQRL